MFNEPPRLPAGFDVQNSAIFLYTALNLDEYLAASGLEVEIEGEPLDTSAPDLLSPPSLGGCISFCRAGRMVHGFSVSEVKDSAPHGVLPKQTITEKRLLKDPATGTAYIVDTLPFSYFADGDPPCYPVVWDPPVPKCGPVGDDTWLSGVTYWIRYETEQYPGAGGVTVSGTLTIQPGAIIKIDPCASVSIASGGKVIAGPEEGDANEYVVFTKAADDGYGEGTGGSDGRYTCALYLLNGSSNQSTIRYCKMLNGVCPINCLQSQQYPFEHNIIDGAKDPEYGQDPGMYFGIKVQYGATADCINNLITGSQWLGIHYYDGDAARISNNTVHGGVQGVGTVGIQLQYSDCDTITDNLVTSFTVCGISIDGSSSVDTLDYNGYWDCEYEVGGGRGGREQRGTRCVAL